MVIVAIVPHVVSAAGPWARDSVAAQAAGQSKPARIISLIPAVSEMLFAIGAGPRVVAVSSFDDYPPDVLTLPRVGALVDPDRAYRVASTRSRHRLRQSDRPQASARPRDDSRVRLKHAGLADVTTTIRQLGERVGQQEGAVAVIRRIEEKLRDIRMRVSGRPRPRTLLVFGRDALALRGVYASGGTGFLHDMLDAAGGDNVFADVPQQSVQATSELVLARRPEAILELRAGTMSAAEQRQEIAVWQALPSVPAVRSGRIAIITDPRTVVPGRRVAEGTELIARALHPEAFK